MVIRIMFKNMNHSDVLEEYARKHLKKLEDLLVETERSPIEVSLVLQGYPDHAHKDVEIVLGASDFKLVAHHSGPDFHHEIKHVIDTIIDELRKEKDKETDFRIKKNYFKGA